MSALPTTGGITTAMIRNVVVLRKRLASQPVEMMVVIEMTDAGRLTRVDCRLVKPKLFNARFAKLPVPPFGICGSNVRRRSVVGLGRTGLVLRRR